jgi:hypothetical protein
MTEERIVKALRDNVPNGRSLEAPRSAGPTSFVQKVYQPNRKKERRNDGVTLITRRVDILIKLFNLLCQ